MLFYAIFWGYVANAQGRWKAFQLPLARRIPQVGRRVLLSFVWLNMWPFFFFVFVWWVLAQKQVYLPICLGQALILMTNAIIPAFAAFGFYRVWLGVVEHSPSTFYVAYPDKLKLLDGHEHVEPVYATDLRTQPGKQDDRPKVLIVHLGKGTGTSNVRWGLGYILVGLLACWPLHEILSIELVPTLYGLVPLVVLLALLTYMACRGQKATHGKADTGMTEANSTRTGTPNGET